jgi:subtilase family protein
VPVLVLAFLVLPVPLGHVHLPKLATAAVDQAARQNPKLVTQLDDLARAVPQERGPVAEGGHVAPPAGFSIEGLPKAVRDAAGSRALRINENAEVEVYIRVAELTGDALRQLRSTGVTIELEDKAQRIVQARVPVARLEAVAGLPFVHLLRLPSYAVHHTGSVDTEGDAILLADQVRAQLGVTGKGVKVGVSSDGLKGIFATGCTTCSGVAGGPISTGDLPNSTGTRNGGGVLTASSGGVIGQSFIQSNHDLEGLPPSPCGFPGAGAEGTAILEVIHDLAPDAQLYFANAGTDLEFNQAVNFLASSADVVVDDVGFFGLPYNGTSGVSTNTAAALNSSTNPIRAYFTAVGNEAKVHYRGDYVDSGVDGSSIVGASGHLHLFQAKSDTIDLLGLGPQPYDPIKLPAGGEVLIFLVWNDPFGASTNNYDLYLTQASTGTVVARSTNAQNGTQDPVEFIDYTNNTGVEDTFHMVIQNVANSASVRNLNLFFFEPECAFSGPVSLAPTHEKHNYNTTSSSIAAESDAGGTPVSVTAVGAICSASAAALAVFPSSSCSDATHSTIEFFSSNGPTVDGRLKPDVAGIDGVSITGAGNFENPFFGSSAASPHAAGVAALLLQSAPCLKNGAPGARDNVTARTTLRGLILNNAVDLGAPGPDDVFGYGRINALAAANTTIPQPSGVTTQTVSGSTPNGANVLLAGIGFSDPNQCPLTFNWTGGCGTGSGTAIPCPFGTSTVNLVATNNGVTMTPQATVQITVTNFAVSVSPSTASVTAGHPATYTVTVKPQSGAFTNAITLGCSNLPSLSTCTFSSGSLTPGANTVTATLTLSTTGASTVTPFASGPRSGLPVVGWWVLWMALASLGAVAARARASAGRRQALALTLIAVLALAAVQVSCGGGGGSQPPPNPGTPPGTYQISITGTSGSLVQSATATLTVN